MLFLINDFTNYDPVWIEVKAAAAAAATQANSRRRANSSGYSTSARSVSPRSEPKTGHGRASSELSISVTKSRDSFESVKGHRGRTFRSKSASNTTLLSPSRTSHSTPGSPLSTNLRAYTQDFNPSFGKDADGEHAYSLNGDNSYNRMGPNNFHRSKSTSAASPHSGQERLENIGYHGEAIPEHEDTVQRMSSGSDRYIGVSWDDLVDRLLSLSHSRDDDDFSKIFLCFFRKFAAPVDFLDSIISRYNRVNKEEPIFLLQMNTKQRILQRLHWWVSECPWDFSNAGTRQRAIDFARNLESNRTFAQMAKDIIIMLNQPNVLEDDDQIWGKKDTDSHRLSMPSYLTIHNTNLSNIPPMPTLNIGTMAPRNMSVVSATSYRSGGSEETNTSLHSPIERTAMRKDSYMSNASLSPTLDAQSAGIIAMSGLLDSLPQNSPHTVRDQYNDFMDLNDEDIAHELTRIDWQLFNRVKPRDIVRHVSVPAVEKERMQSLKIVNRLHRHFNHVAYWVSKVILEKPKAKHRARALEKFMNIAWV